MTAWIVRDALGAKIVAREVKSDSKSIAMRTLTIMTEYSIDASDVTVDNFGTGANVAQELALMGYRVASVNVGDSTDDKRFINLRAEWFWKLREWVKAGGILSVNSEWEELLKIKYKRNLK